jgi:hypothetical protein
VIARDTLAALRRHGAWPLPHYALALRAACRGSPPPFGRRWYARRFHAHAGNPEWLAVSLLRNAEVEGDGARKIWSLASRTPDPEVAALVRDHAVDESRHALMYLALLRAVFPTALAPGGWAEVRKVSPRFTAQDRPPRRRAASREQVLDEIVQMNLGEIRTRVNQHLMAPVLAAVCPAPSRPRIARIMRALLDDETRHIAYTARVLDAACARGDGAFVRRTMARRLAEFNALTLRQVRGHAPAAPSTG